MDEESPPRNGPAADGAHVQTVLVGTCQGENQGREALGFLLQGPGGDRQADVGMEAGCGEQHEGRRGHKNTWSVRRGPGWGGEVSPGLLKAKGSWKVLLARTGVRRHWWAGRGPYAPPPSLSPGLHCHSCESPSPRVHKPRA